MTNAYFIFTVLHNNLLDLYSACLISASSENLKCWQPILAVFGLLLVHLSFLRIELKIYGGSWPWTQNVTYHFCLVTQCSMMLALFTFIMLLDHWKKFLW